MRSLVVSLLLISPAAMAGSWSTSSSLSLSTHVYEPTAGGVVGEGRALLIALHGCAQTNTDLQNYGNFEAAAEDYGVVMALPQVSGGAFFGCWDYYGTSHSRSVGDASEVIALAQELVADSSLGIDANQVYVTGLSSGATMALTVGCLAPDVFAGVSSVAGPAVGTSSSQAFSVGTTAAAAASVCEGLAGSRSGDLSTQMAALIAGTADYTVDQDYLDVNADMFAILYEDAGATLTTSSFDVSALAGSSPAGTGTLWSEDSDRLSVIEATGMSHAWPAGSGATGGAFITGSGVDYASYLADFFAENNLRIEGGSDGGGGLPGGGLPGDGFPGDRPWIDFPVDGFPGGGFPGGGFPGGGGPGGPDGDSGDDPVDEPTDEPTDDPTDDPDVDVWIDAVDATLMAHLDRYGTYSIGYGLADITFTDLLSRFGMDTTFTVYQAPSGDWYLDPDNI